MKIVGNANCSIRMSDGSDYSLSEVQVGESVMTAFGMPARVMEKAEEDNLHLIFTCVQLDHWPSGTTEPLIHKHSQVLIRRRIEYGPTLRAQLLKSKYAGQVRKFLSKVDECDSKQYYTPLMWVQSASLMVGDFVLSPYVANGLYSSTALIHDTGYLLLEDNGIDLDYTKDLWLRTVLKPWSCFGGDVLDDELGQYYRVAKRAEVDVTMPNVALSISSGGSVIVEDLAVGAYVKTVNVGAA